jgi:hypothetical protein
MLSILRDHYHGLEARMRASAATSATAESMKFSDKVTADAAMVIRTVYVARVITVNLDDAQKQDPCVCRVDGTVAIPLPLRAFACVILARMHHLGRRHGEVDVQDLRDMGLHSLLTTALADIEAQVGSLGHATVVAGLLLDASKVRLCCYQLLTAMLGASAAGHAPLPGGSEYVARGVICRFRFFTFTSNTSPPSAL